MSEHDKPAIPYIDYTREITCVYTKVVRTR